MQVTATEIPEVKIIEPPKFGDHRGFFSEVYNQRSFAEKGIDLTFVQDNHSFSVEAGVVRGLHFQSAPFAQDKLVRCTRGRILDVAVDIRHGSPTFGQHVAVELSAENWRQLLVPIGFAHGFMTLEENCEVLYKVTNTYSRDCDFGLLWSDPDLAINWPLPAGQAILSEKDEKQPTLSELPAYFTYGEGA